MGKVLTTVLKLLLLVLLLGIIGVIGYWLHAQYGINYLHLGLIVLGLLALVIMLLFMRRVYYRRRERRFIRGIVDKDAPSLAVSEELTRLASLRSHWNKGLHIIQAARPYLRGNPIYALPWFMVIGESGSGKSTAVSHARAFASASQAGPLAYLPNTKNCDWWFFDNAVVLDTAGRYVDAEGSASEQPDQKEWLELLALLAGQRRREPLNGLVMVVSARQLIDESPQVMRDHGRFMRRRLEETGRYLMSKVPVYLLVSKLDLVLGLNELAAGLTPEQRRQALGLLRRNQEGDADDFLTLTLREVESRLRDLSLSLAARRDQGQGPIALFSRELALLEPGLRAFIQGAFSPTPYSEPPFLRGIFFSSGRQEGLVKARSLEGLKTLEGRQWKLPGSDLSLFLSNFFTVILPRERSMARFLDHLISKASFVRNLGYITWLGLLLALCCFFSLSYLNNRDLLHRAFNIMERRPAALQPFAENLDILDRMAASIYTLEADRKAGIWRYPGNAQSGAALAFIKSWYVNLLQPLFYQHSGMGIDNALAGQPPGKRDLILSGYCEYLAWIIQTLDTIERGADPPSPIADIHLEGYSRYNLNSPAFNRVLATYLALSDSPERQKLRAYLQQNIRSCLERLSSDLSWLTPWLESRDSLRPIYLNQYWRQADSSLQIARAYTADGRRRLEGILSNLQAAVADQREFAVRAGQYRREYAQYFYRAWWQAAEDFHKGPSLTPLTAENWHLMTSSMAGDNNPYFRFIRDMAAQFKAVEDVAAPAPLNLLPAAFVQVMDESRQMAGDVTLAQRLRQMAEKGEEEVAATRSALSSAGSGQSLDQESGLYTAYLQSLSSADMTVGINKPLQIVSSSFDPRSRSQSPLIKTYMAARSLAGAMDKDNNAHSVFWHLAEGPAAFQIYAAFLESACSLNELWESTVAAPARQSSESVRWQVLFGPEGRAGKFMQEVLAPFVRKLPHGYAAADLLGVEYPFRPEFLQFLAQMDETYTPPAGEYKVEFKTEPVNVNRQAEKPFRALLRLESTGQAQELDNYNYPVSRTFSWKPAEAMTVRLEIFFSTSTFSLEWDGPRAFRDFLASFRRVSGNYVLKLTKDNFPQSQALMEDLDLEFIELRYNISGAEAILALSDPPAVGDIPAQAAFCPGDFTSPEQWNLPDIPLPGEKRE
jgi:type VI secretion system protein ImpL